MRGLYAIVDVDALARASLAPLPFAEAVLSARPAALQLRDKSASHGGGPMQALLTKLAPMCRARGVPLFANDRADLAALTGCDGVHVGQNDLPVAAARAVAARGGRGLVGVSAHNQEQALGAIAERPDYVALGPVFATGSKARPDPTLGIDKLRALAAQVRAAGLPVVAIGGIDAERATEIADACDVVAVIAALLPPPGSADPYAEVAVRAANLQRIIAG